ncbi:hypothetical protein [Intestinibacter bartlettii]|uniref:Uncharacterized protein n=1 Tax=Intestinibacter bartlettii CAG:1329 TaxID=1263063 RepID=R5X1Z7_9FIRM|nr:hypothetical protein [Intestinibacter bartlettii]CDA09748.1 putative uncharacterized protein [Intestinibacter bartlettii CAG:1329]
MNRLNFLNMRIRMFISSYFPLYVILLILYRDKILSIIHYTNIITSIFIITLVALCIISIFVCINLKRTKGNENHIFNEIQKTEDTIISYMMTYIVPILSIDLQDSNTLIMNIILYILIGFMYVRLSLIYLNPLFLMCGYYIYKSENEAVIISNISYIELRSLNGFRLKSTSLGNNIYLVQKSDNIGLL